MTVRLRGAASARALGALPAFERILRDHPVYSYPRGDYPRRSVKVKGRLYERASILSRVTGVTLRELVESGLEREVRDRVEAGGPSLREMLARMENFRRTQQATA